MKTRGVITGDIVKSKSITSEWRSKLVGIIEETVSQYSLEHPLKIEFFRGDSFQIILEQPEAALQLAILIRAALKYKTPSEYKKLWDARMAIGIGTVSYTSDKVVMSDGEAFRFSGRELDEIGKKKLTIKTPWDEVNEELKVSTAFADDIISNWTLSQSEVIYESLRSSSTQKELAISLNKTAQSISKLLAVAKESLIRNYLNRYQQLILKNTQS